MTTNKADDGDQGEEDYISGRHFQDAQRAFAKKGPVDLKAHEAAEALDGLEGEALEAARQASARGESVGRALTPGVHPEGARDDSDSGSDRKLDKGLEQTFPASDPAPISPGAD